MTEFIQQLFNGLSLGSIYALIALGYTMIYGILRFINFAHGDVFMIGAFRLLSWHIICILFRGIFFASACNLIYCFMAICALLGIVIES
jgi:branched-chain amino acid transport system permease protein